MTRNRRISNVGSLRYRRALALSILWCWGATRAGAFAPPTSRRVVHRQETQQLLRLLSTVSKDLPEIDTMKLKEIREELESYGISTKAFLEKPEFIEALSKARAEGRTPQKKTKKVESSAKTQTESSSGKPRDVRLKEEMEKAKSMSVGDLRKELTSRGVSTKSFFEKSEFVKAYAEAVVDGVKKKSASGRSSKEDYDPTYRDVSVQKLDRGARSLMGGTVIDIRPK